MSSNTRYVVRQSMLLCALTRARVTTVRVLTAILAGVGCGGLDHIQQRVAMMHILLAFSGLELRDQPRSSRRQRRRQRSSERGSEDPVDDDVAASYARFSSAMQPDESNTDQNRKTEQAAIGNGHTIPLELKFSDEAVSGTKRERDGLNAMLAAAEAGRFKTLYLYSLSRLARESVITLPMLKRLVYKHGVRVISLVDGLDSDRDGWELIAHVIAIVNEQYLKELSASVFRGQEGALLAGYSVGDYRFGFKSVAVPGTEATRRGRHAKPRRVYAIDEETAPWVMKIFHWYVEERRSITWIVKELNRLGAPKDHRATTPHWRHALVVGVLESEKYVGIWPWGEMRNVRDPETGDIRQVPRDDEECEPWLRDLSDLALVEQETFDRAQRRLEESEQNRPTIHDSKGRFRGSKAGAHSPTHLLHCLVECGECASRFYVGGTAGKYLFCPHYLQGVCSCQTRLRRDRAERLIVEAIGDRIQGNSAWLQAVYNETLAAWDREERRLPEELISAERSLLEVDRKIARIVDRVENGVDDPAIQKRLKERRTERRSLKTRVDQLRRRSENRGPQPTLDWVRERLENLSETLQLDAPAAAEAFRDLVGGKIVVTEIRREGRERHYLQGRFRLSARSVARVIAGDCVQGDADSGDGFSEEIVIDFVDPDPIVAQSEEAKRLYDEGLMNREIAKALGCGKSTVTKLLKFWFESRGLEMPDGRKRRHQLERRAEDAPLYQRVSEDAKRLADQGLLLQEIAEELGIDRNTVTAARRYWYESRGLEAPDGRTRRKGLDRKWSRPEREADRLRKLSRPDARRTDSDGGNSQSDTEAA